MKLSTLTPYERECYEAWNNGVADMQGGDCSTIGYAWAAFEASEDGPPVIITEDDFGFVQALTYHGQTVTRTDEEFHSRITKLENSDREAYNEEEEG